MRDTGIWAWASGNGWVWEGFGGFARFWASLVALLAALGHNKFSILGGGRARMTPPEIEPTTFAKAHYETAARPMSYPAIAQWADKPL